MLMSISLFSSSGYTCIYGKQNAPYVAFGYRHKSLIYNIWYGFIAVDVCWMLILNQLLIDDKLIIVFINSVIKEG